MPRELVIQSKGLFYFSNIDILSDGKVFVKVKFDFSLAEKAKIEFSNSIWNFKESGIVNIQQEIVDSDGNTVISRPVDSSIRNETILFFSMPAVIMTIENDKKVYVLQKEMSSQKYQWFKDGVFVGITYDIDSLKKSQSRLFPRLRGMWKIISSLPDNPDNIALAIFFIGLFELIKMTRLANRV